MQPATITSTSLHEEATTAKRVLAVALLVAGCVDSASLERVNPGTPAVAVEAGAGAALYGFNGTIPQNGTALIKEFNPANPPLGSTIVATFVWRGSTNIITSVTDYLWTGRQVGNTYHLVEYVTAGGFSMATYVATNAQNYPDPKQVLGEELVIQATLASSVSAGGVLVSAYTGVQPVFAQAVSGHRSAAGSGSVFTTADPGAITVGAGSIAYGVSLSSDGLVGMDPPSGFTKLTTLSDQSMQFDAEYALPGAGSVDPRWTWSFNKASTWLASVLALNPATGAASGSLTASTSTSGADQDPDGYTVTVDGTNSQPIATSDSITFSGLPAGDHTVELSDVATSCTVSGGTTRTVTVPSGGTARVSFSVTCTTITGDLAVTTTTTGSNLDPDGYTVTADGSNAQSIATSGTATFTGLSAGSHSVALAGVAANCSVLGANPRTVTVAAGGSAATTFSVSCAAAAGRLAFISQPSTTTAGSTLSPPVRVSALDGAGNTDASFNGVISLALGANPGGGMLSGTTTVAAASGVATFSNLSIGQPGHGYTLQATASGVTGATSTAFDINPIVTNGIVFDQRNGTLGANGTAILKGFNPTNPHRGAALVASFFWLGSSNIITSVSDHLTDGTPVGNSYTLVEYVTAGGLSMATYVATNVQNFPDPNPDQNRVLVVQANLASAITDGGVMLSAYGGVHAVSAQALGAHRSATGSGSSVTAARPGAVTADAGALTYGVTLSNGVAGIEPPAGFTNVTNISDATMEADGEFAVRAGAGSVDLQWTWFFNAPSTWLATVLALNPAP